jgi:hypothetical protein
MRQRDHTDWMALFLMLVVAAAFMMALLSIGLGMPLPFIDSRT